jgi:hypothetical protein
MTPFAFLLFAVSGTVVNQTTGQPQPGATVTLYKITQAGPEAMTSIKSAAGGKFDMPDTPQGGPHMLQTAFGGITYNKMLPPGRPTTDLTVDVFNPSAKPDNAKVATHMILLEPDGMKLHVNESVIWRNEGNTAFYDEKNGTMRFFLPPGAGGKVKVNCTAPQGMPVERPAVKTAQQGVYTVDFPVKPGETRFDLMYEIPMTGPGTFTAKVLHSGGPVRLVAPSGVTLEGDKIKLLGNEPSTQAGVYELSGTDATIAVSGTGALRGPEGEGGGEGGDNEGGEGLKPTRPRVYARFEALLAIFAIALVSALALLYRKSGNIQA